MAQEKVTRSDMSGEIIEPGKAVRIRLMYEEKGRPDARCDLSMAEAEALLPFAYEVVPRPRRVPVEHPRMRHGTG